MAGCHAADDHTHAQLVFMHCVNPTALVHEKRLSHAGLLGGAKGSADHGHYRSRQECDHLWGS